MHVALFSPVWFPVPPDRYGGIEAIVQLLADGLVEAGADVTLFASGDSSHDARLVSAFDVAPSEHIGESYWELQHLLPFLEQRDEFDLVHDHSGLARPDGARPHILPDHPHRARPAHGRSGRRLPKVCRDRRRCRARLPDPNQRRPLPDLPWVANVNNAIDVSRYPVDRKPGDSLLFLGRMSPDKGAHRAIRIAQRARPAAQDRGKVPGAGRDRLLRRVRRTPPGRRHPLRRRGRPRREVRAPRRSAHALLVPIEWEEPFGLVMIEALASGTPVIAMRRGSVPEILRHGETAMIADDLAGMVALVDQAAELDPARLRREAETRFSVARMVEGYLDAYEMMILRRAQSVLSAVA